MVKVNTKQLKEALKIASKIYPTAGSLIGWTILETTDNFLTISVSDYTDIVFKASIPAQVKNFLSAGVDKTFISIVRSIKSKEVTLAIDSNNNLIINDAFTLPLTPGDRPPFNYDIPGASLHLNSIDFSYPISRKNQNRFPYLYIHTTNNTLNSVWTDGYRLTVKSYPITTDTPITINAIIPAKYSDIIPTDMYFQISEDKDYFYIFNNCYYFKIRKLKDVIFPNYQSVIPHGFQHKFVIDRDKVLEILNQSPTLFKHTTVIVLEFNNDILTIEAVLLNEYDSYNKDIKFKQSLKIETPEETFKIAFNRDFLIDAFNSFDTDKVYCCFNEPDSQALFTDNFFTKVIVMPMDLSDII